MSSGGGHGNIADSILHSFHNQGIHFTYKPFLYVFLAMNFSFLLLDPAQTVRNWRLLMLISPFWLTYVLVYFAALRWLSSRRVEWLSKQEHVLLEVRMPRDVRKTPLAMELVLNSMHHSPGESTWWKKYIEGRARPWWSFEIASIGGKIHFYIWTRKGFRRGIESYFYGQYPGVEIVEATDYSRVIDPSHAPNQMWGCDYHYSKSDAFPIRTYREYIQPDSALAKPEEQIDQLAQILEILGSIGPKEQFWVQILFRVHKGEKYTGQFNKKGAPLTFKSLAADEIEALRKSTVRTITNIGPNGEKIENETFPNPSKGVQLAMESIDRKANSLPFDVNIRSIYSAPNDAFQGSMITHLIGLWKPYFSDTLNSLPITRWLANFDDQPWQDIGGHHKAHLEHQLVDAYRQRAAFHEPYKLTYMVMSSEELASLYHPPSSGVTTPSLPRIGSRTTEAPSNLPT